jgi:hypothetical protein
LPSLRIGFPEQAPAAVRNSGDSHDGILTALAFQSWRSDKKIAINCKFSFGIVAHVPAVGSTDRRQ